MRTISTMPLPESIDEAVSPPSHEDIAACAHALFEQRGCVDGHDVEDWLEAEGQALRGRTGFSPLHHLPMQTTE